MPSGWRENFNGNIDNTDVPKRMGDALGIGKLPQYLTSSH